MHEMYEMRYVAFIDILGFKNKTNMATRDNTEFLRIKGLLEYIAKLKQDNPPYSKQYIGMEFSMFSDSIVISYPVCGKGNAFNILIDLAHLCLDILAQGYILRGGVTVGYLFHKADICFGPAMNIAVNIEKMAKYPRVIIDQLVLSKALQYPGISNSVSDEKEFLNILIKCDQGTYIEKNDSPVYILHYLSLYSEFDDFNHYLLLMDRIRNLIITEYGNTFLMNDLDKRRNVQEKYVWFANYFNDTIKNVIPNCEQFEIKLN